jgi:hypothetical protein
MPTQPTGPAPDPDDTDAGYRDTLEEEAYEQADQSPSSEDQRPSAPEGERGEGEGERGEGEPGEG